MRDRIVKAEILTVLELAIGAIVSNILLCMLTTGARMMKALTYNTYFFVYNKSTLSFMTIITTQV